MIQISAHQTKGAALPIEGGHAAGVQFLSAFRTFGVSANKEGEKLALIRCRRIAFHRRQFDLNPMRIQPFWLCRVARNAR